MLRTIRGFTRVPQQNEAKVGKALAEAIQVGLVKREDLFITTKLWSSDHGHVHEACKDSLKQLRLDYMDLYLVHLPVAIKRTEDHVGIMQKFV
ncbi:NADP-dependent D-sorbitol-6-phosphate dehydrogenase-like isoform X2 [Chenopodium quinoa]|uniref:NADP-dependent D-sorbitol-6-phosphate dehydrogenase-like isoform X2 n=1 Tax=Chenopodium quinoa TaxID=63459 RepID=UPI000B79563D|nr:NADP-dependent D-sorbitol-6-phosphate dehydrogenase-like isoform X2 [Chenopodium quinoa]